MGCLVDDDLLELVRGGALGERPTIEAHLAGCAACSALVAALLAGERDAGAADRWGALVGQTLGPYRLEGQIGAGAAGAVYRAWDERLRRRVAVKVLLEDGAHARWVDTEARAAAAITHPNVVTIHDVGRAGGHAYVVSELVEGESLRSVLSRGALEPARAEALGIELARGLAAAHGAGVIHRDLKPENLLVARDGTLKILDFGLAKLADGAGGLDATIPGTVLGTVGYMAPEQARGAPADARADLFAAGAILYEMHTGRRAFDGASHAERLSAVLRDTPPDASPIIARCLAKDPAARFQSAADLLFSLESETGPSTRRQPARSRPATGWLTRRGLLLAAGTGALGLLAGRALFRTSPTPPRTPVLRQLTFRQGRIMSARFARHGADIYYGAAWDGEPLATHALRLDGGVARALALPAADVLAVSRTQLALALGRRNIDGQAATGRLALAPIDGGLPRELTTEVQEADFTPDGSELAVVTRRADGFRLELPAGKVVLAGAGWITHPRVSPDGRHVACLLHPDANDDQGELVVVDRATGARRTLSDGWASVAGLAWDPRGDVVWMTGSRTGADNALRAVSLDGTERVAYATLGRLRLHDVAADGRMLISRDVWRLRTMVGGAAGPDLDRSLTPFSLVTDLSPDGAALLLAEFGDVDDVNGVYLVPTDGGPRLRLGPGWPKARSPDGSRVFAVAYDRVATGRPRPVLYSVAGGGRTPLAIDPVATTGWAGWLDDAHLVLEGAARGRRRRMWRLAIGGGPATPLTPEGIHGRGAVDPTGRVAFIDDAAELHLLTGDTTRVVATGLRDHLACGWHDGDILVRTAYAPVEIRRVALATGAATPHLTLTPPAIGLKGVDAVALAGSRHAYSYGQELSELFLLDLDG